MPLLRISTNQALDENARARVLSESSRAVAGKLGKLGKLEQYVMVELNAGLSMSFAGSTDPLAYLELKSIGLPEDRSTEFSATLCRTMASCWRCPRHASTSSSATRHATSGAGTARPSELALPMGGTRRRR